MGRPAIHPSEHLAEELKALGMSARFAFGAQLVPALRSTGGRLRCFRPRETIDETLLAGRDPVRVPLQRGGWLAVSELSCHVGDWRALGQQQGGERVTQVVDAETSQLCFLQRRSKVLPYDAMPRLPGCRTI
jgi:hypothetical protein